MSLAYPSGKEGGILLVQMMSTCLRCAYIKVGGGGGVSTLCVNLGSIVQRLLRVFDPKLKPRKKRVWCTFFRFMNNSLLSV
jgi:hypothetical protein